MKWLVVTGLLATLLSYGGCSAIRCTPGKDATCPSESEKEVPSAPVVSPVNQEVAGKESVGQQLADQELLTPQLVQESSAQQLPTQQPTAQQVECLAGSEWFSNCHYCRCADSGIAECLREETCDDGVFEEPLQCKPNTTFVRDCNTCACLENGLALCTVEFCRRSDSGVPPVPMEPKLPLGVECAPGTTWKNPCSECRCSDTGYRLCDPIECEEKDKDSEHVKQLKTYNDDKQFSAMIKESSKNSTKEVICVANRMFIKDCNTCWCNDDGTSYFCTRKVCVPELPDESNTEEDNPEELRIIQKECRPDEVFELECNMCRCNRDGKSFSCTRRACIDQEDLKNMTTLTRRVRATPQEAPKACQPGQEFRLDCNKCLCDNEGQDFSCTRIDCNALNNNNNGGGRSKRGASDLDKISSECTPGSVFEKDCNTCRCTTDGHHAMCTNKRCTPEVKQSKENDVHSTEADPGFRCDPGEQFKKDCKDCTCSADGKSYFCTLHLCDEFIAPGV